jgi:hypothetical protein
MELALCVIGQMASGLTRFKFAGFQDWTGFDSSEGLRAPGRLLVHDYLDRCRVAEVA